MRRRRQLKEKKREREIQQYEREQVKLGQLYNPEQSVDEQLALARKSGWHVDIVAEFSRAGEKEKGAAAGGDSSDSNRKNWWKLLLLLLGLCAKLSCCERF